ncbi:MAG: nuclear transport factor 2 family protein [Pseudoxanthomonas suwonensis]|nr:nuclear transport factor 2 family protein [Pseudoxanthomonas suwonensis]
MWRWKSESFDFSIRPGMRQGTGMEKAGWQSGVLDRPESRHPSDADRWWAAWCLALLTMVLFAGCGRAPPEERLREQVVALREAILERNAAKMADHLATDFIGPDGMDRQDARRMATGLFLRYPQVGLHTGPLEVEVQPDGKRATVRFTAVATGTTRGIAPDSGRMHQVVSGWRIERGEWKLLTLQWTPVL